MQKIYIGLDIGGTKIMAAATDMDGNEIARLRADTPYALQSGLDCINRLIAKLSAGNKLLAIGSTCGGPLDAVSGIVSPLHQPKWHQVPLKSIIEERWRCPFSVDVDTNVGALGEYHFGGYTERRFVYITISTGMGGGILLDGNIYSGAGHPEVGHQMIYPRCSHPERIICDCGAGACLEALISGSGIRRIYGKPAEQLEPAEWDEIAYNLGQGLRNIVSILSPEIIVLGGVVAVGGGEAFVECAARYMSECLKIVAIPRVQLSRLGYDTALRGACWLAKAIYEQK